MSHLVRHGLALCLALAAALLLPIAPAPAHASQLDRADRVLRAARSYTAVPYSYGGTTRAGFDCSGFTQAAYRAAGKRIPRTSGAQYASSRHLARADKRPGDLLFLAYGGKVSHVMIYAGGGYVWHASRPGSTVDRDRLWTSAYLVGRPR